MRPANAKMRRGILIGLYAQMVKVRKFEDKLLEWCSQKLVPGIAQLCQGQEASVVGSVYALRKDDWILATYRGHGQCIVKGTPLAPLFAEALGRRTGCCKGKGGPMHFTDMSVYNPGIHPIVGAQIPIGCGVAMALKMQGSDRVCLVDFGDGAAQTGVFHESLNMASLWRLPVVFVCENNLYAVSVPFDKASAVKNVADRASAYAMLSEIVDGMDVLAVYEATGRAVERARRGEGPTLIECKTYRFVGHSQYDVDDGTRYRSREEIEEWRRRDPIIRHKEFLISNGIATEDELDEIQQVVNAEVDQAAAEALAAPWPEVGEAFEDVYA